MTKLINQTAHGSAVWLSNRSLDLACTEHSCPASRYSAVEISRSRKTTQMPHKNCVRVGFLLFFCCTFMGSCTSKSDDQLTALLRKGVEHGYPGIAMLVQEGNGKIHSAASGYSDLEHRAPMRVDDAFHMASINKTFTAVSVLRLVDQAKLSLNSTLQE